MSHSGAPGATPHWSPGTARSSPARSGAARSRAASSRRLCSLSSSGSSHTSTCSAKVTRLRGAEGSVPVLRRTSCGREGRSREPEGRIPEGPLNRPELALLTTSDIRKRTLREVTSGSSPMSEGTWIPMSADAARSRSPKEAPCCCPRFPEAALNMPA
ncbi:hypothetical protein DFJ74DRAFT_665392 [Hyaloraphidium curvatum]|nr:hypothetical protein DFJ74DRAFT_665392 [Hyaloraphidium curvatum]